MIDRRGDVMLLRIATVFAVALAAAQNGAAAEDFYAGKTVDIIVGYGPGGGYDIYSRLIARHLGRHIPGNPTIVVQNMDGAGSLRAANYVLGSAPRDGSVIASANQSLPIYALAGGEGVRFDASKLQWLGSVEASNSVLVTFRSSGVATIADARDREVPLGSTGVGSDSNLHATAINSMLSTRFKIINGYKGGRDIQLAIERGEVAGRAGITWSSVVASVPSWISERKINVLLQLGFRREVDLPDAPLLTELVTAADGKQLATLLTIPTVIGFGHWVAPEVPKDRVAILRQAYDAMNADQEFIADAARTSMHLRPQTAHDIAALLDQAATTPKPILRWLADMLNKR
jgi:tripartite-type tricarboxylate transporter receptor subunit TctC